ncbi:hypothetical protein Dsin_024429 [Dipteronia sinensis]|uniref:Amino acid transporter transmembrane domain-containing protein n=1 Tax=Dipteronia sinensis TaxID=43782 RepID=A0AAD9ZU79_9ROSI|nr:hypothetical protein Dsin_024429 [Dipteronia sinensis]
MAPELQKRTLAVESGFDASQFDDDGRVKRTGIDTLLIHFLLDTTMLINKRTLLTASAHIITAVIGSGVLSLAWALAQLGWIAGPIALIAFSIITWFTSALLADSYRSPFNGTRNYTYREAVKNNLGGIKYKFCALAQYVNLVGITIGYTITASISMAAVKRSNCFHKNGHEAGCHTSNNMFMTIFGVTQIILSQIPNFHELSALSIMAAIMSFAYSLIGLGLSLAQIAGGNTGKTSLSGVVVGVDVTSSEKLWGSLQAIGNIAFAYAFSTVLVEIQAIDPRFFLIQDQFCNDTLKSSPPENREMKKATLIGVSITTIFYTLCGTLGYAAFGNNAPGNFLTGFGFYEPFWLIDFANICIVVHLVGAYQVFCQPIYNLVEEWCSRQWPESKFIKGFMFRLIWRTFYVIVTCVIAMLFPFFNSILGLLGALSFWPLTVYFPIEMYISRSKIRRCSFVWTWLKVLSGTCLVVSLLAAAGSIEGLIKEVSAYKPFNSVS